MIFFVVSACLNMSDTDGCESLTGYPSHPDSEYEDTRDEENFHPVLTVDEPGSVILIPHMWSYGDPNSCIWIIEASAWKMSL